MVEADVVRQRLTQLATSLKKIKRYKALSLEEFLKDEVAQDVVEYNLFIAINMMIDIACHAIVDNNLGNPDTVEEAFAILEKEKYLSSNEARVYRSMVGLRNILSHEYLKVDKEIIYNVLQNGLLDLEKFILFANENFL